MKERRHYDERFKREAAELVISSGRPLARVARELGISAFTLKNWKDKALREMGGTEVNGEQKSAKELYEENRQLRKENEYLKRQRDILKKAASILAEEPLGGMR